MKANFSLCNLQTRVFFDTVSQLSFEEKKRAPPLWFPLYKTNVLLVATEKGKTSKDLLKCFGLFNSRASLNNPWTGEAQISITLADWKAVQQ